MRRSTLLFLIIVIFGSDSTLWAQAPPADGPWKLLEHSPFRGGRHEDIAFLNSEIGWLVNLGGEIHKTIDGGQTWTQQLDADGVSFRSVGFANEQVGWAGSLTRGRVLYETRDGGQSWQDITNRITGPAPGGICGMWVVNDQVAYGIGRYNGPTVLIKTTDGGQTWTAKDMGAYAQTLVDVFFFDENRGVVVGGTNSRLQDASAVVLTTFNGGATWSRRHLSTGIGEWGWKISFPSREVGYVSIERFTAGATNAKVLKTTDGGSNWEELRISGSAPLQGLGFVNETLGWSSGRGVTSVTTDGGLSWREIAWDGNINRFRVLNDSLAFAVGRQVYKYSLATATNRDIPSVPTRFALHANYPNPFNPTTTITYDLAEVDFVELTVHDMLGRLVATLVAQRQEQGRYAITWDGRAANGQSMPSGTYLYRLTSGDSVETQAMMLIK